MRLVTTPRVELLREVRSEITHNYGVGRTIVAVDGISGSGTAAFADGLAEVFAEDDRAVFRASIDDFHRPREERYARGRNSPEGYYSDSFDYSLFRRALIEPFRMAGSTGFQLVGFDEKRDTGEELRWVTGPKDATLIVDGVFLHRPELRGLWHYSLWLDVTAAEAYSRLSSSLGVDADPFAPSNARYVGGQELYQRESGPRTRASAVITNEDEAHPLRVFLDSC
ncbi:uridine kinase [Mycetocola zhadangensis]|uniref:Uridine kinase n=1 Tax=Mycetocola zhadangensis TaxID=1164595 RepID=A0A3L7IV29_9MICO|nr:uridine kinase [Mycetocola zhadangensis]RLQ81371.1 uridine kinase [Mycetocola zhadangensis]GGF02304.1 uridine kinase [Mycetocola zhadangensis]